MTHAERLIDDVKAYVAEHHPEDLDKLETLRDDLLAIVNALIEVDPPGYFMSQDYRVAFVDMFARAYCDIINSEKPS